MSWNDKAVPPLGASDTESALAAGVVISANDADPETRHFVVVPSNYRVESTEQFRERPRRISAAQHFIEAEGFAAYVNEYKGPQSKIFSNAIAALNNSQPGALPSVSFRANIDYPAPGLPSWNEHVAALNVQFTREWRTWTAVNKKPMSQTQFVEFLENNILDIKEPDSASLIEIARKFEVKKTVNYNSACNLDNGSVQFVFEENVAGSSGKGTIEIPSKLTLGIKVFEGMLAYVIDVKLRWRLADRQLSLWIDMLQYHLLERGALKKISEQVEALTAMPVFQVTD